MSDGTGFGIGIAGSAFTVRRRLEPVPADLTPGLRALRASGARSVTVFLSRTHRAFLSKAHGRVLAAELAAIGASDAARALRELVEADTDHRWIFVDPLP